MQLVRVIHLLGEGCNLQPYFPALRGHFFSYLPIPNVFGAARPFEAFFPPLEKTGFTIEMFPFFAFSHRCRKCSIPS